MGLKQVILGQGAINAGFQVFSPRGNDGNPAHGSVEWPWPCNATLNNLALHLRTTPAVSTELELFSNNAGTGLKATVPNGSTDGQDTTHSASLTAGDLVCMVRTGNAWVDGQNPSWSFTSDAGDDITSVYGFCRWDGSPIGTGAFTCFNGERGPLANGPGSIITNAGNVKSLWIVARDAPGTGKSRTFAIELNGVVQDGTGGTINTTFTMSNAATTGHSTFTLPVAAGDVVRLYVTDSGSPGATSVAGSISFQASIPGHYFTPCHTASGPNNSATNYVALDGNASSIGPSATENDVWVVGPAVDEFDSDAIFAFIAAPGGGKSWTYTLRKAGADVSGGPSLVISGTATSGHASGTAGTYTTISDYLSLKSVPSGTPTGGGFIFSLAFIDPTTVPPDPTIETRPATHVRSTVGTLNGRINPNGGAAVTAWFEWGLAGSPLALDQTTAAQAETGILFLPFSQSLSGLTPGTTYYFRAVASNSFETFYGEILSFTTVEEVDFEFTDGTASHPLVMREFVDRQGTSYVAAEVDLNDPGPFAYGGTGYEHGYKEPRILGVDIISRGLSDAQGQLEHLAFGLTEHDTDYFWRTLLAESPGGGSPISRRYLTNRPLILKIIDDEDRRALKLWRVVANGYISDYTALPNLKFRETGTDWIKKRFSRSFRAQYAWQRLIDLDDFPNSDAILTTGDNTQVHVDAVGKAVPVIYGRVSDAGLLDADPVGVPVGVYKPIYAGDIVIGGDTYRTAVICGHAASIVNAYVDDVEVDLTSDPDWLTPNNPTAWSGAGFATDYTDLNGRRYFIIYIKGTAGDIFAGITQSAFKGVGITLNVWGVEDVGDGTGTVIDHPVLQHKHFVMNYLAPSAPYDSGDWLLVSATFETLPTLTLMDEESFDATATFINDRLVAGEYVTAGVIGANGELVGAEDALAWWKNTAYYEDYFNRRGQYGVTLEPAGAVGGEIHVTDVMTVVDGSLSLPEQVTSQFWNAIPFVHTRDYTGRRSSGWHAPNAFDTARTYLTFRTTMTEAIDDTGVANYEQAMTAPRFDLHFGWAFTAQGTLTIVDALIRRLNSFTNPRRQVILTGPFSLTSIEPGQVFKLSTLDGIDPGGWTNHYVRAVRHAVDLSKGNVQVECYDIGLVWGAL